MTDGPYDPSSWEDVDGPHVWRTMGWQRGPFSSGEATVRWDASEDHAFPGPGGPVVHGGLVSAVLDCAMASAAATLGGPYLTATLQVDLVRAARPGPLTAHGSVVRRTRAVVFCQGELRDAGGTLLASGRATQVPLPLDP